MIIFTQELNQFQQITMKLHRLMEHQHGRFIEKTLPLLVPVIKTCVIFAITGSLRTLDLVYVMTGGGPNHISEVRQH